jgi:uncharacterized protein YjbJ (UPF0337 family)
MEDDMNSDQLQGKWKQYKGQVKEKWGKLTDDDLDVINGRRDQLVGKIQERYGIVRENAEKQTEEFLDSLKEADKSEVKTRAASKR